MKWISVEDGLPKDERTVLAANNETVRTSYYIREDGAWGSLDSAFWNDRITHWMPLPELPE